jgi:hypothetical protein
MIYRLVRSLLPKNTNCRILPQLSALYEPKLPKVQIIVMVVDAMDKGKVWLSSPFFLVLAFVSIIYFITSLRPTG